MTEVFITLIMLQMVIQVAVTIRILNIISSVTFCDTKI